MRLLLPDLRAAQLWPMRQWTSGWKTSLSNSGFQINKLDAKSKEKAKHVFQRFGVSPVSGLSKQTQLMDTELT